MTISEERSNRKEDIRNEFMRMHRRVQIELRRREIRGFTLMQAVNGLMEEIGGGNYISISSPETCTYLVRRPSMVAVGQILRALNTVRETLSAMPGNVSATTLTNSRATNFGNAVRNLEAELSAPRPSNQRTVTPRNRTSMRTVSPTTLRRLTDYCRRNANGRERTPDPSRNGNELRRLLEARRDANEPERPPPSREDARDLERVPFPGGIVRDPERTPPPRPPPPRTANATKRMQPRYLPPQLDPNIPAFQYNPKTFDPTRLTLKQAITVMNFFDIYNDSEYKLIKRTLLHFTIKIYGLEDCPKKDFGPLVERFIERYFKIQPDMQLCARPIPDDRKKGVVGVIFKRFETAKVILAMRHVLYNTRYRVSENKVFDWILYTLN